MNHALRICGEQPRVRAISQRPGEGFEAMRLGVEAVIREIDDGAGILFLVDVYGGTPANVVRTFLKGRRQAMVTGVNLGMLIRILESDRRRLSPAELADVAVAAGRSGIDCVFGVRAGSGSFKSVPEEDAEKGAVKDVSQVRASAPVQVCNKMGLHAAAAAKIAQIAVRYQSTLHLSMDGEEVNGKSITGILMLAAGPGSVIVLKALGGDAAELIEELKRLFADKFGED